MILAIKWASLALGCWDAREFEAALQQQVEKSQLVAPVVASRGRAANMKIHGASLCEKINLVATERPKTVLAVYTSTEPSYISYCEEQPGDPESDDVSEHWQYGQPGRHRVVWPDWQTAVSMTSALRYVATQSRRSTTLADSTFDSQSLLPTGQEKFDVDTLKTVPTKEAKLTKSAKRRARANRAAAAVGKAQ